MVATENRRTPHLKEPGTGIMLTSATRELISAGPLTHIITNIPKGSAKRTFQLSFTKWKNEVPFYSHKTNRSGTEARFRDKDRGQ